MKVYQPKEKFTSVKTHILQLQLSLELSQIQKIQSTYSELFLCFAKYSFLFESSITDLQPLKSTHAPVESTLSTQDPNRDGGNWWIYCRNNPLTYVDPSGLTTLDDFAYQKETSGDWSHKEASVYQQRASEANREYSPVNIQQSTNLPGEEKKDFFVFQQDIDYLLSINPKYPYYQNSEELGFINNFRLNACNFMSYLFDVQDYTGYNFSILEIASLVGYAQNKPNPVNKDEMCMLADFEVRNPDIIMNKAFEMTGHPELTATAGYNIGDLPCRTYTNITVKTGLGNVHRVVGDFEGNVIYNPWNGGTITEINTIMKVYIHGVMKK